MQSSPLSRVYAVMSCDLNHMHAMRMSTSDVTLVQYRHCVECVLNTASEWRVLKLVVVNRADITGSG